MTSDNRTHLISATRELLAQRGYTGTSPHQIQERAGVGQGSMYHHFAGKPELAAVALSESGEALLASAADSLDAGGSAFDRLAHYLRRERSILQGCPVGRMTEDVEVMSSDALRAPIDLTLHRLRSRVADVLEEGERSGELKLSTSPGRIASTIVATIQGAYVLAKAANEEQPFVDAIEGAIDLLRSQLAPATSSAAEGS